LIAPSWVGDLVQCQSLIQLLRQRLERPVIDIVLPSWTFPLAERLPGLRRAYELAVPHGHLALAKRWKLARKLRESGYDEAIVIPRSWKSALVPYGAKIPKRTGFSGENRHLLLNDKRPNPARHTIPFRDQILSLGLPRGVPLPNPPPTPQLRIDAENRTRLLSRLAPTDTHQRVALMPGAEYGPSKRWPVAHFGALARKLLEDGQSVWILGSANDRPYGAAIAGLAPGVRNFCGQTSLPDVVDLLSSVTLAVTNDSGLMHVAAAVGIPLVGLYGSSSPRYTPPAISRARLLSLDLECSPCFARECPLGHLRCLRDLPVDRVFTAVKELLPNRAGG
jgi:heptosyltransferase-2